VLATFIYQLKQDRQGTYNVTLRHCCRGKAKSITHYECAFVALVMQHATRMRNIVWGLPSSTVFSHIILQTALFFPKKRVLNIKCVFWLSLHLLSETFLILRRTERDMIKKVYSFSCKVPVILVRF